MKFLFFVILSFSQYFFAVYSPAATIEWIDEEKYDFYQSDDSLKSLSGVMYSKGIQDAKKYYHDTRPFAVGFATGFFAPPVGLAVSSIMSLNHPKIYNLGIPYDRKILILNQDYLNGYTKTAQKRKALLTWAGFITGSAFLIGGLSMFGYTPHYFFSR